MLKIFRGIMEVAAGISPEIKAGFEDEELCRRCGRCCYAGVKVKNQMVTLKNLPCMHLTYQDDGSAFCTVYKMRDLTGWCNMLSVESVRKELFPDDCPYMVGIPNYKGKVELSDDQFEEIKPILKNIFKVMDKPDYVRRSDWERFLTQTLGMNKE